MGWQMKSSNRDTEGFVYVITNSAFAGYVKIGITKNIKNRLRTYQTSAPMRDYKVEHYIQHPNCYKAEKDIHEALHYFALSKKNEWFEVDLQIAIDRVNESLESA
jgi:predicted GIY-YIG superfamily endonuclease